MQILPTITTITNSAWVDKLAEIKKLKLEEVCLFPTCLNKEQREKLYDLLKDTNVKRIPFVHLRSDMDLQELDYLVKNYQTKIFNVHTQREYDLPDNCESYRKLICIENTSMPLDEREVKEFGGVCLDIAHLENDRLLRPDIYRANIKILEKYPPKCSHISVIKKEPIINQKSKVKKITTHYLEDLSELDYLKRYPLEYFGSVSAIELENTIEEQLRAKEYIKKLLENYNDSC